MHLEHGHLVDVLRAGLVEQHDVVAVLFDERAVVLTAKADALPHRDDSAPLQVCGGKPHAGEKEKSNQKLFHDSLLGLHVGW